MKLLPAMEICRKGTPVRRRSWPTTEIDFQWIIYQLGEWQTQQYQFGPPFGPRQPPFIVTAARFKVVDAEADDWVTYAEFVEGSGIILGGEVISGGVITFSSEERFEEVETISVPASSCLHFAYAPIGASVTVLSRTDTTIDVAPPLLGLRSGTRQIAIAATGLASNATTGGTFRGPDGDGGTFTTEAPYTSAALNSLGIPSFTAPRSSLIGLWAFPSHTGQPFFIGGNASLIVPEAATGLYFGISDGYEWSFNQGGFEVSATLTGPA